MWLLYHERKEKTPVSNQALLLSPCKNVLPILGVRLFTIIVLSRKEEDKGPPHNAKPVITEYKTNPERWKWDSYLQHL